LDFSKKPLYNSRLVSAEQASTIRWGVAKLVKAPDFDSGIRRFESFFPSQASFGQVKSLPDFHCGGKMRTLHRTPKGL
jgi:hypothetical protein